MEMGLHGKVVLVTGGSSGIGEAVAKQFGMEGAKVVLTYSGNQQSAERVAHTIQGYGTEAFAVKYDLRDDRSMIEAVEKVGDKWGQIHVLVNNAVHWTPELMGMPFENAPTEGWRGGIRANLEGYFFTIQRVLPYMRKTKWGRIINISSELAEDGQPGGAAYTAAKAGLHGLTATLAKELGRDGIFTNVVMPGWTMTEKALKMFPQEMIEQERHKVPTGKHSVPDDIANLVLFLGSEANGNINGEFIRVTGGR